MSGEPELTYEDRLFRGLHDDLAVDPGKGFVRSARNFFLERGMWRGRPGTVRLGASLGSSHLQGLVQYEKRNGTAFSVAFSNGQMFTYNWGTDTFDQVALGAGVVIDPAADLDYVVFNDRLVVTDGVNQPWSWDGASFFVLDAAPVARSVTVYYLKVFFSDLPSAPSTFMWSEEADETIGYDGPKPAGGSFNNVWTFGQVDSGRILAAQGLNESLLIFKEDTIAAVRGAVEPNFAAAGTREDVSGSLGLISPRSIVVVDSNTYFLSAEGPAVVIGGVGPARRLDQGRITETWKEFRRGDWREASGVYDSRHSRVMWSLPRSTADNDWTIVFGPEPDPNRGMGDHGFTFFSGWEPRVYGRWENPSGNDYVVFGDNAGGVFRYTYASEKVWDDDGVAVSRFIESRPLGRETPGEKNYDRLDFLFRLRSATSEVTVRPVYDGIPGSGKAVQLPAANQPIWGTAQWNVAEWGASQGELVAYSRGLNGLAREAAWRVEQKSLGATVDLLAVRLAGSLIETFAHDV